MLEAHDREHAASAEARATPAIVVRDLRFGLSGSPVRHWFGGDLFKTIICDGLSIFLPTGERFFIRSLKHYLPQIEDAALAESIREFTTQEAYHTREHEDYNRAMEMLGYDVAEMERPVKKALIVKGTPVQRLAITCAIEHITASLSFAVLRRRDMLDDAAPAYRRLWIWHALEELEHKAVALDVFHAVTQRWRPWQRYLLRTGAMLIVLGWFHYIFFRNARLYARHDGVRSFPRFVAGMARVLLVTPGFWRSSLIPMLGYFRPGFDPRAKDDHPLIDWARGDLEPGGASRPLALAN